MDTLSIFGTLKQSFTEEQAHALSNLLNQVHENNQEVLSTKQDLNLHYYPRHIRSNCKLFRQY